MKTVKFWPGHPLSYTTTKIDVFFNDTYLASGTGFVHRYAQRYGLVTNLHVLTGINPTTGKPLSPMGGIPNRCTFHAAIVNSRKEGRKNIEQVHFKVIDLFLEN